MDTGDPEPAAYAPLILVADDDETIRRLFARALGRKGFRTVLATNGREAIEELDHNEVDVALLDVSMPVLDGLDALHQIRSDPRHRTLPIILVTASDSEEQRVRGLEGGADDYVAKPVNLNELTARVRAHLRGRSEWTRELELGRERRRRLAAALESLPREGPLVVVAPRLLDEVAPILDVDGLAVLHFTADAVRTVASSRAMARVHRPGRTIARDRGRDLIARATAGAWLRPAAPRNEAAGEEIDIAYVPFRHATASTPLGCLAFGRRPGHPGGPLRYRLPDLVDATDFIAAVLRPALERAETTDSARSRLRQVIASQAFEIHLQPIVDLATSEPIAVEALTRFPSRIRPDLVFAEAASLGLGPALQRATLAAALEAASTLPPSVAVSVNLSADVLLLEASLPRIIGRAGRPVIIEITEHERIDDYAAVRAGLARLGDGVTLAIDDAGSGYASLRHILALQPAYVKLDIEWVHDIDRDPVRRALVSGLIHFASETGCELIAEGIETPSELEALLTLGVRFGQGYLLGQPKPPSGARLTQ